MNDISPSESRDIVSPVKLAHVVFRTTRFKEMIKWYKLVLNAHTQYENDTIAFLAYDDEHHRVAFIHLPKLEDAPHGVCGVHHIAFTYPDLTALLNNFEKLREIGIKPAWSVNHGPTISLYYVDPDANQIEFQVDNFASIDEANEFMFGEQFNVNPIGVDFDADDLLKRLRAGEADAALKARPFSKPRDVNSIPIR
jgi:catechol-2,3-dioxygenase